MRESMNLLGMEKLLVLLSPGLDRYTYLAQQGAEKVPRRYRKVTAEAKAEMKKIRSSLSLSLPRAAIPRGVLTGAGLQRGRAWEICCCWGRGLSMRFSACYSCPSSRGRDDNRTGRGPVDKALCVTQHPSVRSR